MSSSVCRAALLGLAALAPSLAYAQDGDGDSIPDVADAFPCDPSISGVTFVPGEVDWSTLAFEDQWPESSDLDFNDVVVRAHYRIDHDAQGRTRWVVAVFDPVALGGMLSNGLGLQLPVSSSGVTVRRRVGGGAWETLSVEADSDVTVVASTNLRELFGDQGGQINSDAEVPHVEGQLLELEIGFPNPVSLNAGLAPFDVFIFRAGDLSHQIHFPQYRGTSAMNSALFGTGTDATSATRAFVDGSGLPFALALQDTARYPLEGESVDKLFPDIVAFAASGGATHASFYLENVVERFGYSAPTRDVPRPPSPELDCTFNWVAGGFGACVDANAQFSYGGYGACSGGSGTWSYGSYASCSASAVCSGSGTQTRSATCNPAAGSGTETRDATCSWSPSSGTQTRSISCVDRDGNAGTSDDCLLSPPATIAACTPESAPACAGSPSTTRACTPSADAGTCGAAQTSQGCASPAGARSCAITNGTGTESCAAGGTSWGTCTVVSCNSGYAVSGNTCVASNVCVAASSGYRRAFVSDLTVTGSLGNVAGADSRCQSWANTAGLGGTWRAWISNASSSPSTRFVRATVPYVRCDGVRIAANYTALTAGTIEAPINISQTRAIRNSGFVFSFTRTNGTPGLFNSATSTCYGGNCHCNNWSTTAVGGSPIPGSGVGQPSEIGNRWTDYSFGNFCGGGDFRLYCFEQ